MNDNASETNEIDKTIVSDPMAELAVPNYKSVRNCTELYMAHRDIELLAGFEIFTNIEVLWLNNNKAREH